MDDTVDFCLTDMFGLTYQIIVTIFSPKCFTYFICIYQSIQHITVDSFIFFSSLLRVGNVLHHYQPCFSLLLLCQFDGSWN
jgi:hypothetical protein